MSNCPLKDVCPSCPEDSRIAASMSHLGSRIAAPASYPQGRTIVARPHLVFLNGK